MYATVLQYMFSHMPGKESVSLAQHMYTIYMSHPVTPTLFLLLLLLGFFVADLQLC